MYVCTYIYIYIYIHVHTYIYFVWNIRPRPVTKTRRRVPRRPKQRYTSTRELFRKPRGDASILHPHPISDAIRVLTINTYYLSLSIYIYICREREREREREIIISNYVTSYVIIYYVTSPGRLGRRIINYLSYIMIHYAYIYIYIYIYK